jgi:hypothetical protein
MPKSRVEAIEYEIENCLNIIIDMELEKDIALLLQDFNVVNEIAKELTYIRKRISILKHLLEKSLHPSDHMDFVGLIIIKEKQ